MTNVKLKGILKVIDKFRNEEDGKLSLPRSVAEKQMNVFESDPRLAASASGVPIPEDGASGLDHIVSVKEISFLAYDPKVTESAGGFPKPILRKDEDFSIFNEEHAEEAADLVKVFVGMSAEEFNDAMDDDILLQYNRDLLLYALRSAMLRRPDTATLPFPPLWQLTVRKFFKTDTLKKLSNEVHKRIIAKANQAERDLIPFVTIGLGFSGNERDLEHKVAYFREDIGVNSHHWHWHAVYPFSGLKGADDKCFFKDRQGELFYYMHQQMLARYDAERLSNDLCRVLPFRNFREPIEEGYASHLSTNGGIEYSMRSSGLVMKDTDFMEVNTMERWRDRLYDAIDKGYFILPGKAPNGASAEIDIDRLSYAIEATTKSPNKPFYGSLHNMGHRMLAKIHDPDQRYEAPDGVMGYEKTAVRDPLFFRWHKHIDDIFVAHKETLPEYKFSELIWQGMKVESIKTLDDQQQNENTLSTFWNKRIIDLSTSIDFKNPGPTKVELTHLDHQEFQYQIVVENRTGQMQKATFRIFMAPTYGDIHRRRLSFNEQRRLFFEMDKFVSNVKPGKQTITRSSQESSVTIPFEKDKEEVDRLAEKYETGHYNPTEDKENYCGCGWPHHLLLPRGSNRGQQMDLFVMLTDWEKDKVEDDFSQCLYKKNHASYCGVFDKKYPDKQPMGFPFDRAIARDKDLGKFCSDKTNMNRQTVTIKFDGED